jgi:predicted CXXCH cytochrome family protein
MVLTVKYHYQTVQKGEVMSTHLLKKLIPIAIILCSTSLTFAGSNGEGNCLLSGHLQESKEARIAYMIRVTDASLQNINTLSTPEEMYSGIIKASVNATAPSLDQMSLECMTCHDGLAAPSYEIRVKNDPNHGIRTLNSALNNHPIGMDYRQYASASRDFRQIDTTNGPMIFVKGRVGCLTCHNPLNPEKDHLVMSNQGSALCLTCHSM